MSHDAPAPTGRTRWRRFAAAVVPAVAVAAGIVMLEGQGALAASFRVSGIPAVITADRMVGQGFGQYGYFDAAKANSGAGIPGMLPVAVTGIKSATLYNLCQSVTIPGFNVSLVIKAGTDPARPVTAQNLFIDMDQMSGDAKFTNIEIGNDASDLDPTTNPKAKGPAGLAGPQNMFGQQADMIEVTNLRQRAYATSAGTFVLNNMSLDLKMGTYTCPQ
jgi:hypothetical protein